MKRKKLRLWVKIAIPLALIISYHFLSKTINTTTNNSPIKQMALEQHSKAILFESEDYIPTTLSDYQSINDSVKAMLVFNDNQMIRHIPIVNSSSQQQSQYWMNHNIYGEYDTLGSAFFDENTPFDQQCSNHIIHGHSSYHHSRMFTFLRNYLDGLYFDQYPTFEYHTNSSVDTYKVIAIGLYDVEIDTTYNAIWITADITKEDIELCLLEDKDQWVNTRSLTTEPLKLLTLITCDMENEANRIVLIAQFIGETNEYS